VLHQVAPNRLCELALLARLVAWLHRQLARRCPVRLAEPPQVLVPCLRRRHRHNSRIRRTLNSSRVRPAVRPQVRSALRLPWVEAVPPWLWILTRRLLVDMVAVVLVVVALALLGLLRCTGPGRLEVPNHRWIPKCSRSYKTWTR